MAAIPWWRKITSTRRSKELSRLNRLVTMFIDYAELMAEDQQLTTMADWLAESDRFLLGNRRQILEGKGMSLTMMQ